MRSVGKSDMSEKAVEAGRLGGGWTFWLVGQEEVQAEKA